MNKPSIILYNKYIHSKLLNNQLILFYETPEITRISYNAYSVKNIDFTKIKSINIENITNITNSQIKKFIKEINKIKLPEYKKNYFNFYTPDSNIFYIIKTHKEKNLIVFRSNYKFKFMLDLDKNFDYIQDILLKLNEYSNRFLNENEYVLFSSLIFYLVNLYTKSYLVMVDKSTYSSCFYHKLEIQEFKNPEDILYKFYETIKN